MADLNDLEDPDNVDEDDDEGSVSNLSFFGVPPDLVREDELQAQDDKYFETRLKELTRMTESKMAGSEAGSKQAAANTSGDDPTAAASRLFSDPRFKDVDTKDSFSTFSPTGEQVAAVSLTSVAAPIERPLDRCHDHTSAALMTPQRQFQLLNQTLRRPDGSSNPDIDLVTPAAEPPAATLNTNSGIAPRVPPAKRSPGSGQSSSDHDEEEESLLPPVLPPPQPADDDNNEALSKSATVSPSSPVTNKKESRGGGGGKKRDMSHLAFMLMRLFGSSRGKKSSKNKAGEKRSKSCDRELDSMAKATQPPLPPPAKSASSSPLKRYDRKTVGATAAAAVASNGLLSSNKKQWPKTKEAAEEEDRMTPSRLSLDTEWEFQAQEQHRPPGDLQDDQDEEVNGNSSNFLLDYLAGEQEAAAAGDPRLATTYAYAAVLQRQERKSSGYDSLEGENSSLDSSGNNNNSGNSVASSTDVSPRGLLTGGCNPWTNVYRDNNSLATTMDSHTYRTPVGGDQQYAQLYAELDEIALLKMEINRHPDILNKNY